MAIENRQAEGVVIHSDHGTPAHTSSTGPNGVEPFSSTLGPVDPRTCPEPDRVAKSEPVTFATQRHRSGSSHGRELTGVDSRRPGGARN